MNLSTSIGRPDAPVTFRGFRKIITADIEKTRRCVLEAITFVKSFGLDDTFLGEMELVLMEAVTNTVKHTKGHSPERAAGYLEILISEDGVESRIEDGNVPYREKMTGDFPDVDSVGGRGFPIMELLMDEVKHVPLPEGNLLILTKKIPITESAINHEKHSLEQELNSLVEELMSCYECLTAFFKFGSLLSESDDQDILRDQMLHRLLRITGSDCAVLRLLDSEKNALINVWSLNLAEPAKEISLDDTTLPEIMCARSEKDIWTHDHQAIELQKIQHDAHANQVNNIGLVHTLSFRSETLGTLWLQRNSNTHYSAAQINMIHTFSEFLAIQRANSRYKNEMLRIGKMEREMQIARDIQCSLLPPANVNSDIWTITGVCQPAREVGGDYFDFLLLSPHSVLLVIADIMGKGIPASLFVAIFRSLVHSQSQLATKPAQLAARVNQLCYEDLNRVGMFLTAQFCYIDLEKRVMRVANAGHWPLLFIDRDKPNPVSVSPNGLPIGVNADFLFEEIELALPERFNLAMYTDGIPEATDTEGKPFGEEGMKRWIISTVPDHSEPDQDIQFLIRQATECTANKQGQDDLSILLLKTK